MASAFPSPHPTKSTNKAKRPIDVTFGLELELVHGFASNDQYAGQDATPQSHLKDLYDAHGMSMGVADPRADADYDQWRVIYDGSLNDNLGSPSPSAGGQSIIDISTWKVGGQEIVSRKMTAPSLLDIPSDASLAFILDNNESLSEIKRYISVLRPAATHNTWTYDRCGLHLHIGTPSGQAFPLIVNQHVALLTVEYEHIINSLHPYRRTPHPFNHAAEYATSNRIGFQRGRHSCGIRGDMISPKAVRQRVLGTTSQSILATLMSSSYPVDDALNPMLSTDQEDNDSALSPGTPIDPSTLGTLSDHEWDRGRDASTTEAERDFWDYDPKTSKDDASHVPVSWPSSPAAPGSNAPHSPNRPWDSFDEDRTEKNKIVRYTLLRKNEYQGPKTLEFRQSAGTVDLEEVVMTILFYVGIVRAAERMALEAGGWDDDEGKGKGKRKRKRDVSDVKGGDGDEVGKPATTTSSDASTPEKHSGGSSSHTSSSPPLPPAPPPTMASTSARSTDPDNSDPLPVTFDSLLTLLANTTSTQSEDSITDPPPVTLDSLLSLLRLPPVVESYWRNRAERYQRQRDADGDKINYPEGETYRQCSECRRPSDGTSADAADGGDGA